MGHPSPPANGTAPWLVGKEGVKFLRAQPVDVETLQWASQGSAFRGSSATRRERRKHLRITRRLARLRLRVIGGIGQELVVRLSEPVTPKRSAGVKGQARHPHVWRAPRCDLNSLVQRPDCVHGGDEVRVSREQYADVVHV